MTTPSTVSPKRNFSLMKLYLALTSLAGIIGIVIVYGQMLHTVVTYHLISNEEYVQGRYSREMQNCEAAKFDEKLQKEVARTETDITTCKKQATERVLMERNITYKESLVAGITRGLLFIILFITHFTIFYKSYKKEE